MAIKKSNQQFIERLVLFVRYKHDMYNQETIWWYNKLCNEQVTYMYDKHQALMKCGVLSHDILQSQLLSHGIH
jgi:hypothetical protein